MNILSNILNTWQFNVIAYLITTVIFTQYYKHAVTNIKRDGISLVILQLIGGISILIFVPFFTMKFSADSKIYGLLFLAIIFYTVNDRLQTSVRKNLEVSIYSMLNQLSKVFLIVYGILVFKQEIVVAKLIGGGLIFLGNIALFYKKGKYDLNKYVLWAIVAAFFLATGIIIDVNISTEFNLPVYIMLTLVIPSILIFIIEKHSFKEVCVEFSSVRKKYYLITGISWGLLILFMIRALQIGETIVITPLMATTVFLNVIAAYFMHKEQAHIVRKILVSVVIVIGIYLTVR